MPLGRPALPKSNTKSSSGDSKDPDEEDSKGFGGPPPRVIASSEGNCLWLLLGMPRHRILSNMPVFLTFRTGALNRLGSTMFDRISPFLAAPLGE